MKTKLLWPLLAAMQVFLASACEWPFTARFRLAWGVLTKRYRVKKT